jgi:hypothetical protein
MHMNFNCALNYFVNNSINFEYANLQMNTLILYISIQSSCYLLVNLRVKIRSQIID